MQPTAGRHPHRWRLVRLSLALPLAAVLAWSLAGPPTDPRTDRLVLAAAVLCVGGLLAALLDRFAGVEALERLSALDPFRGRLLPVSLAVYGFTRLPFVTSGSYGRDPDAWRLVRASSTFWNTFSYERSRPPGNPVVELAMAPASALGPTATNLLTAGVGLVGQVCFDRLLRRLEVPHPLLGTLIFALLPMSVELSSASMDYAWALTAVLAGTLAVSHSRWRLAGVLLGLAVGCRIASAPFVLLVLGWGLWQRPDERRQAAMGLLACMGTLAVVFAPVLLRYGVGFFRHASPATSPETIHRQLAKPLGGIPALVALVWLVDTVRRRPAAQSLDTRALTVPVLALGGVVCAAAPFVALPLEGAYLWPVVPFLILLGLRHVSPWTGALTVMAVLFAGQRDLGDRGLLEDGQLRVLASRLDTGAQVTRVLRDASLEPGTVLLVGPHGNAVQIFWQSRTRPAEQEWGRLAREVEHAEVIFATLPEAETLEAAIEEGRTVLALDEVVYRYTKRKTHLDLEELGVPLYASTATVRR